MANKPIYVIDTNILVDYPDIIPNGKKATELKEPTIDLSHAHIVIPTAVVRELSSFKKEKSERGKVALVVLKRLRSLFEPEEIDVVDTEPMLTGAYNLKDSITVGTQVFSILPIHKDFKKTLPFSPSDDDMDGQIILATIATEFVYQKMPIDGTATREDAAKIVPTGSIILLTNDNGLAIRARRRGVITSRYGYKMPPPYTGRRDVIVPNDVLKYFLSNREIELDIWKVMVPSENGRVPVANEFIIMHPQIGEDMANWNRDAFFSNIGRYDAEKKSIVPLKYAQEFPDRVLNAGQAIYAEALMNPDFSAVICTGPAGSGKTYMATVYGYDACRAGRYIGITVVPCASQNRIGALPGDMNDKMDPDVQPIKNSLRNFLLKADRKLKNELKELRENGARPPRPASDGAETEDNRSIRQKLDDQIDAIWNSWFNNLPIESARGRDFSYEVALYDEFQDQNATQADTLIKRLGMEGKIVITGDVEQVHAPYLDSTNNGLVYAAQLLYDNPMVAQVHFTEEEVVRHPLVKMVAERQKSGSKPAE